MATSLFVCAASEESKRCVDGGNKLVACAGGSHLPCLGIATGSISYFFLSIASMIAAAERMETSCSPDLPPKIIPTRRFLANLNLRFSKNSLSQSRQNQLNTEFCGFIVDV